MEQILDLQVKTEGRSIKWSPPDSGTVRHVELLPTRSVEATTCPADGPSPMLLVLLYLKLLLSYNCVSIPLGSMMDRHLTRMCLVIVYRKVNESYK